MKKTYYLVLFLVLSINVVTAVIILKQNSLLNEYKHKVTNLEVRMEDLDDAIENDVVPRLQKILNEDQ
jgi:phosphopantetheine adenylyltransferase